MRHPSTLRFALAAAVLSVLARAADFTPEAGFTALFNGHDLTGWHHKDGPPLDGKTDAEDGRYTVKDGALAGNGEKGRVLLWTVKDLPKNFVLRLEFRAAAHTDGGIFFNKTQLQCGDYATYAYKRLTSFKPQDWNSIEVTMQDGAARCTCNGELLEAALKVPESGQLALEADKNAIEYRNIRIKPLP
ncbi:MAG TPA: DUF1080 domain-containing protein [Opitutaceae bacterium]|nr:DUF1080 domain-containing protein [Opitutaceae bacterium]